MNTPSYHPRQPGKPLDIPDPQDILVVLDAFDANMPIGLPNMTEQERRDNPKEVLRRAGYQEVRKILLYAYYCSLRDSYERR